MTVNCPNPTTEGCCIMLYDDDVLLLSSSVTLLVKLLPVCKRQLTWWDMSINFSKSCCIRIGPRCDRTCRPTSFRSLSRHCLAWTTRLKFLVQWLLPLVC